MVLSMTLAHQTRKGIRAAAYPAGYILESDPESVARSEKEKKDDRNLESNQKREKFIAARIDQPLKSPSWNEDEDYEDGEEEASSDEDNDEGREENHEEERIYEREDNVLYNAKENEEEF